MNDTNEVFVDRPRREGKKWKKNNSGAGFANKAKKQRKRREREMHEDDLDKDLKEYK